MKSLNKVKPQIEEINGLRCVIVEQTIDEVQYWKKSSMEG